MLNDAGAVVGMVSEGDLMRPLGERFTERRDWWLNLLAEGTDLAKPFLDSISLDRRLARDVMTTPVITAGPETSVAALADLLTRHRIKRVPIVRDQRMIGIVSRADIIRAVAQQSEPVTAAA